MNRKKGLIQTIIIVIIAIAIISYLGFDLKKVFESNQAKSNYSYVWNALVYIWVHFLAAPVLWFWNNIVVAILWRLVLAPLLSALQHLPPPQSQ